MGWGDQGRQHQTRVSPSQSMTIPGLLHVRCGSFASKAAEAVRPCTSADCPKADVDLTALASAALCHNRTSCSAANNDGRNPSLDHLVGERQKLSETSTPSTFAVLRLITNSNLVGCKTDKSAGLTPLRTRPA